MYQFMDSFILSLNNVSHLSSHLTMSAQISSQNAQYKFSVKVKILYWDRE